MSGWMVPAQNHTKVVGGLDNATSQISMASTSLMEKIQVNLAILKACIGSMNRTP